MTIRNIMNHIATRAALAVGVAAVGVGALFFYVQSNGGLIGFDQSPIVWLSDSNIVSSLSLKPGKTAKDLTAAPTLPVLLIECPRVACESADLNLRKVTKELEGKVIVLALDPYDSKAFTAAVGKLFINDQLQQNFAINLAMRAIASSGQQPTQEVIMAIMQDPKFLEAVVGQMKSAPIMQQVYPKVFLFAAKDFHLLAAVTGLTNHDDLMGLVKKVVKLDAAASDDAAGLDNDDPLSAAAPADPNAADPAAAAPAPPAATSAAAPPAAAPPATTPPAVANTAPSNAAVAAPAPQAGKQP